MKTLEASPYPTTPEVSPPSAEESERFIRNGIAIDADGKPLHPWRSNLPDLPPGKGALWHWGPNYTADPIVISQDEVPSLLLIRRAGSGKLALPGGFIDDSDESASIAGLRELKEEAGITLPPDDGIVCYRGPVHDDRGTLNAWPETTAILWRTSTTTEPSAGDDAEDALWVPLRDVRALPELYGSHASLIETAIYEHGTPLEQLEYFGESAELVQPSGGHMGYRRVVASLPTGKRSFIKQHSAEHFTDPARAEHSRQYLHKEFHIYSQLKQQTPYIPSSVQLQHDTLTMDALDVRDGWLWRAPCDSNERDRYITDILNALHSLEDSTVSEYSHVAPSYTSIIDEGWGSYPRFREHIVESLRSSSLGGSDGLLTALDELANTVHGLAPLPLTAFTHFDLRQSNVAWHPEHGVQIVDWSWAGTGPHSADATSFLVDLAKAGIDISPYVHHLNPEYALLLIGFWIGHSTWSSPTQDLTVRDHQLASAITAYNCLRLYSPIIRDRSRETRVH